MVRAVEKIILVVRCSGELIGKFRIDEDVAGGAGATATAQCKELIDAAFPDHLHDGVAFLALERQSFAATGRDVDSHHARASWSLVSNFKVNNAPS